MRIAYQTVRRIIRSHASFFIAWIMPFLFFNILCIIPIVQTTLDTRPILMTVQEYLSFSIDGLILAYYFARGLTLARNLNINKKLLSAVFGVPLTIFLTLDILPFITILTPADRLLLFTVNDYYLHLPIASLMLIFYFALSLYLLLTITKTSYVISSQIKSPTTEYPKVSITAVTALTGTLLITILTFIDRQGLRSLSMLTLVFLCWLYPVTLTATAYYLSLRNKLRSFFDWPNIVTVLFLLLAMKALVTGYSKLQYRLFTLIDNFPRSELGFRMFGILSFPVAFIRAILQYIGVSIPTYIGVAIGISLLVAVWVFILRFFHRVLTVTATRTSEINFGKTARKTEGGRLGLVLVVVYAIIIRIMPIYRFQTPTGRDTPFYITLMQQGLPIQSSTYISQHLTFQLLRVTQYLWAALGAVVKIPNPIPPTQLMLVELIPVVFNVMISIAVYALAFNLTENRRIGVIAAIFAASSPSQIYHLLGLYDSMLGIIASLLLLMVYNKASITKSKKAVFLVFLLAPIAALMHQRPFAIIFLTIFAYIVIQSFRWIKNLEKLRQIKSTLPLYLGFLIVILYFNYRGLFLLSTGNWLAQQSMPLTILTIGRGGELFDPIISVLALLGIISTFNDRDDSKVLLITWLSIAYILAHQVLFYIYLWPDDPRLPRFMPLLYLPLVIFAAIGIETLLQVFHKIHITRLRFTPRILYLTVILLTIVSSAYVNANKNLLTDLMPSGYHTFQWVIDSVSPTSAVSTGGYLRAWITYHMTLKVMLKPPWEQPIVATDCYVITRVTGPPYDNQTYARVYDDGLNTVYYAGIKLRRLAPE